MTLADTIEHLSAEESMSAVKLNRTLVMATAHEVLPKFGLAFVVDDDVATWTITRNMEGPGLDALKTGQRIRLTLDHHPAFSVVRTYDPQG